MTDKITIERETLEQAMSVLHEISPHTFPGVTLWRRVSASIAAIDDALSAALAAQAKAGDEARAELARLRSVEPIGWYDSESGKTVFGVKPASKPWSPSAQWLPFFAAPPAQPADPIAARSRYETAYAGHQLPHTQTTTSEPVQLTEVEIFKAYTTATGKVLPNMGSSRAELVAITRIIERAHGITGAKK